MSVRPRHHDRHSTSRLRKRHANARGPCVVIGADWRSPQEALFAYTKAGCVEAMRELIAANTAACARHLAAALVIAEVEYRCARPEDEHDHIATMEALLEAGAPASELLPDMVNVLPTLQARALGAALPSTNTTEAGKRL